MATENDEWNIKLDRLLKDYYEHKKATFVPDCPPAEDLLDYSEGKLADEKLSSIVEHLPFCDACHDIVLSFAPSSHTWQSEASTDLAPALPVDPVPQTRLEPATPQDCIVAPAAKPTRWDRWIAWTGLGSLPAGRFWLPATLGLTLVIGLAVFRSSWQSGELSRLSRIESQNIVTESRSAETGEDELFATFSQGLKALLDSQSRIFNRVDLAKLNEGIRCLETARKLAEIEKNQTYMAESRFYLGKAYLKKKDLSQARKQFEEIIALGGSSTHVLAMQHQADEILKGIDRIERSGH